MTNREWLAQNPERISGVEIAKILKSAAQGASRMDALEVVEALDKWFDAERKEPESVKPESTVVMTFEVTDVWKGETPMPQLLSAAAESRAEQIKSRLRADDVTVAKIQCFVRDAE